jgi:ABC-type phosphate transport system substrate-binding protein
MNAHRPAAPRASRRAAPGFAALAALAALGALAAAPARAAPDGFVVVVHPDVRAERLDRGELSRLFLKKATRWPDGRVVKVVEPADEKLRGAFAEKVHGKSLSAVRAYWNQVVFSGRDVPPAEKAGDAAVVQYVRSNPGAIGYVAAGSDTAGARAVPVRD